MAIKRYSNKEPQVFLWIMIPYILIMNTLLFGTCIYHAFPTFIKSFLISVTYFFIVYGLFGWVAVVVRNKYPASGDLFRRVGIMLPVFYVMNVAMILGVYHVYAFLDWITCVPLPRMFWWTVLYGCIMSTVITFINEGLANWEKWKNSLAESERLRNAYQRSKLLGLKGQINPHFLFNCFNTLSGLIHEDSEKAEEFLDEMTRVHRYLLRGDDEYLVTVGDEVRFANAYLNLITARFGEAIDWRIQVPKALLDLFIPPLSLQVILENIIYNNVLSKHEPLQIRISGPDSNTLAIAHSLNEKTIVQNLDGDEGLDNLITKYRLLSSRKVEIEESAARRDIRLPLFDQNRVDR